MRIAVVRKILNISVTRDICDTLSSTTVKYSNRYIVKRAEGRGIRAPVPLPQLATPMDGRAGKSRFLDFRLREFLSGPSQTRLAQRNVNASNAARGPDISPVTIRYEMLFSRALISWHKSA